MDTIKVTFSTDLLSAKEAFCSFALRRNNDGRNRLGRGGRLSLNESGRGGNGGGNDGGS